MPVVILLRFPLLSQCFSESGLSFRWPHIVAWLNALKESAVYIDTCQAGLNITP